VSYRETMPARRILIPPIEVHDVALIRRALSVTT